MPTSRSIAPMLGVALALSAAALCAAGCAAKPAPQTANSPGSSQPASRSGDTGSNANANAKRDPNSGMVHVSDEILAACGISYDQATFPLDSADLQTHDLPVLDQVARCFTSGALRGRAMKLVGRADPRGELGYNMLLGHRRADSVASYVERAGLPASQVSTTSRGAMDASGTDETTWQHDRRVDVLLGS